LVPLIFRERTSIKKLNSFDSPIKQTKDVYCNCPMEDGIKYSCSNGRQWIKNCFNFYDYSKNLQAYNALVKISNNREIVDFTSEDQIHKDLLIN